jgi:hypothetical protein
MAEKKILGKGEIYIVTVSPKTYFKDSVNILKYLVKMSNKICYVNINKFLNSLKKSLEDNGMDTKSFIFVDAISKSTDANIKDDANRKFIRSPSALTELSITIAEALTTLKPDALFFDSISACLIYNSEIVTIKFLHTLMGRIRAANCTAIFICLEKENPKVLEDLGMFVDGTLNSKDFI